MERLTKKRTDNGQYYLNGLAEVHNSYPDGFGRIQVGCAIDKLAEYEELEEQGKLLKLPCEIGHRVYMIYQFCGEGAWEIEEHKIKLEDLENIGKTVFLTRQAAEDKLAEMDGKK